MPSTVICLASFLFVSLPITVRMVSQTYGNLTQATSTADLADVLVIIASVAFFQSIWVRAWWRRHGERVRPLLRRLGAAVSARRSSGGAGAGAR
ncbi:hypothetical protein [Nonomuraea diastatica]|uniref:hypothetical protein n=1 Tax=Nonomuraea diastatica TaxID=1848329 RepID=UPI00140CEFE1|nr:hypothetical protein [Nonomuraea diastatica]